MNDMELAEEIERIKKTAMEAALRPMALAMEFHPLPGLGMEAANKVQEIYRKAFDQIIAALRRWHEPTREAAHQMRQTISHAVARGWGAPANSHKGMDTALAAAIVDEVICAIKASPERPPSGEMVMVSREQFKWNYQCPSEARECEARDFCAKHQCCGRSGEPLLLTYAISAAEASKEAK